jgi:hypothetical protein
MAGFKSQTKRRRELAKLDKRKAKDEKRALRKAERSASATVVPAAPLTAAAPAKAPIPSRQQGAPPAVSGRKPLTLAEAVERWKATKVVKAKPRW